MLQFKLDQWQRTRLAGTGTFKPVALSNITTEQPAHGPAKNTDYGRGTAEGLMFPMIVKVRHLQANWLAAHIGAAHFSVPMSART